MSEDLDIIEKCHFELLHPVTGKHYQMSYEPGHREEAFEIFRESIRADEQKTSKP